MGRFNEEGIPREDLLEALARPDIVRYFRRRNQCMLCMRPGVGPSGLCEVCYSMLDGKELDAAVEWNSGVRA